MPDILIRGVALPKYGCAGCYFKTGKYCGIIAKNENVEEYSLRAERHPDCPLRELPPHGDLIDMDKIRYTELYGGVEVTTANWIDSLPVIVPAEREGET